MPTARFDPRTSRTAVRHATARPYDLICRNTASHCSFSSFQIAALHHRSRDSDQRSVRAALLRNYNLVNILLYAPPYRSMLWNGAVRPSVHLSVRPVIFWPITFEQKVAGTSSLVEIFLLVCVISTSVLVQNDRRSREQYAVALTAANVALCGSYDYDSTSIRLSFDCDLTAAAL